MALQLSVFHDSASEPAWCRAARAAVGDGPALQVRHLASAQALYQRRSSPAKRAVGAPRELPDSRLGLTLDLQAKKA